MRKRSWVFKTVILVTIIGGLLWFNHSVLHLSPPLIQKWIISFGWAAPVLYILIYTVRPLILFPASILSLTGGLAFGPLWGTVYTVIGATMGAVLSFIAARVLGKRLVRKKWMGQWHKVEKQLEERGFLYILILRLIPLFPFDLISYASGVSKVKLTAFFFGTLLGIVPGTFMYNFLGSSFVHGKKHDIVIAAVAFILVLLIPIFLKRKISKQKGESYRMKKYDLIVIGAGAGGLTVAAGAAGFGVKVALIEKEPQLGGDCLHTGCVPSKTLIAAAKELYTAKKAAEAFGLELTGEANYLEAYRRVQAAKSVIQHHDDADRFRSIGVDVYQGHGRFRDEHHVEVDGGELLHGKRMVIATGSRAGIPPIDGLQEVDFLTNESVFDVKSLPKSLIVIGAGPVGLELSQAFARLGSKVTLLVRGSRLLKLEDEELVPYAQAALEKELSFMFDANVSRVEAMAEGKKRVIVKRGGEEIHLEADAILVAVGRKPNTDRLGLLNTRIQLDGDHIAVKKTLQTTVPHIFAVGDVIKPFPFTHAAGMEGKTVIGNAVFGLKRKVSYDHVPWVTYTDPEIFHLGMTEDEAREQVGDAIHVYKVTLDHVDRFITDRETDGIVKVITDRKGKILGAHAVGKGAGEWMQEVVFAKRYDHKLGDISQAVHPYPTHGEALMKTADQFWHRKLFHGVVPRLLKAYVKWFR